LTRIFYIILIFLLYNYHFDAQIGIDSTNFIKDSLFADRDSLFSADSILFDSVSEYNVSKDALEDVILWGAKGLEHFDQDSNKLILIDEAYIKYGDINLSGGYLEIDLDKNEVIALPLPDSSSIIRQKPVYKDKTDEFEAKKLRYNIKSKKAWVEYAAKKEGELTVHGYKGKYISKEADSVYQVDKMFIDGGIITNCTNDHPHWGIKASKIKLIPNKLAIFGYSMLQIADVPIYPLTLPFGFYPMFQGQKSGLILPRNVDINEQYGIGFKDIGVYFVLNDYVDIRATADLYTRGTHGIYLSSNYNKRYKFRGSASLSYFNEITESRTDTTKKSSPSFRIYLSHSQDSKAHPYQSIGGTMNLQFANFQKNSNNDAYSRTNNIISSNLTYNRRFPDSPFSLTASFNHDQNNSTRAFNVTFPRLTVNMNTIYPFKIKNRTGKERWYEKISLKYDAYSESRVNATDTTIFILDTLKSKLKTGLKQSFSTGASFTVFKYINIGFNAGYNENHYFKIVNKNLKDTIILNQTGIDDAGNIVYDTLFGQLITDTISDWRVFRQITPSVSLSTNKYGKLVFDRGWLRGIKHKVSYSVSISGNPFDERKKYIKYVDTDTRPQYNKPYEYNIFELGGPYGTVSPSIRNISISYGINNYIDAKFFSKKDSTVKKISLLKGLSISGSYNVFDDSLNFSPVRTGFNLPLFKNFIYISYNGQLDFYEKSNGNRINKFVWDNKKIPLRHDYSSVGISVNNKSIDEIIKMFRKTEPEKEKQNTGKIDAQEDKLLSILKDFRLNYNVSMRWEQNRRNVDTFFVSFHSVSVNGTIPLSKNWNLRINNFDYNIKEKRFEYPDLGIERDLHCWRMSFSWRPSGGSYTFFIGVKSSVLQFVKYNHGQDPVRGALNSSPVF
jgi:hypothetical protein